MSLLSITPFASWGESPVLFIMAMAGIAFLGLLAIVALFAAVGIFVNLVYSLVRIFKGKDVGPDGFFEDPISDFLWSFMFAMILWISLMGIHMLLSVSGLI